MEKLTGQALRDALDAAQVGETVVCDPQEALDYMVKKGATAVPFNGGATIVSMTDTTFIIEDANG